MLELQQATASKIQVSYATRSFEIGISDAGQITAIDDRAGSSSDMLSTFGLVDLQVNGFGGVDFNAEGLTADMLDHALTAMLATGVTRCLPTLITAQTDTLRERLKVLDKAICTSRLGPVMVDGIHLEGPFLSPEDGYAGCHPKDAMCLPSLKTYNYLTEGLTTPIALLTLAPELEGSADFIREIAGQNITVALGHTRATREEIEAAVAAGALMSTHLGNGIAHLLEKNNNPLFAQLGEDNLVAGLIADGIHVPPFMLQSWMRAKQTNRIALVTDATAAAAAPPGSYTLGDVAIERGVDGVVREAGSPYLAGSSATLDQCVRNVMKWFDYDFETAFLMARDTPLSVLKKSAMPAIDDIAEYVSWGRCDGEWHVREARIGPWQVQLNSLIA